MTAFKLSPFVLPFKPQDRRGRPITVAAAELVGRKFGRWFAAAYCGGERSRSDNRDKYVCICDCGTVSTVGMYRLKSGLSKSCGCLRDELTSARASTHGACRPGRRWPEYGVWAAMHSRCKNPKNKSYADYGGRGIKVDPYFDSFANFIAHLGRSNGLTLERFEVNDDYAPGNVGWATRAEQSRNKRMNVYVLHEGKREILTDAIRKSGKAVQQYYTKIREGKTPQDAFNAAGPPNYTTRFKPRG